MVHDTIDIERCVWDLSYRRKVKRLLNYQNDSDRPSANQNLNSLPASPQIHPGMHQSS